MVPLVLGSDKTLVSNATSLDEFHPLYILPGNVKNSVHHMHCNALIPIRFLAIPKSTFSSASYKSLGSYGFQAAERTATVQCASPPTGN